MTATICKWLLLKIDRSVDRYESAVVYHKNEVKIKQFFFFRQNKAIQTKINIYSKMYVIQKRFRKIYYVIRCACNINFKKKKTNIIIYHKHAVVIICLYIIYYVFRYNHKQNIYVTSPNRQIHNNNVMGCY